jgi:hypothetical protein
MSYEVLTGPDGEDEERRRLEEMLKRATRKPRTIDDIIDEMSPERRQHILDRADIILGEMMDRLLNDDHEGSTPD